MTIQRTIKKANLSEAELETIASKCLDMSDNSQIELPVPKKLTGGDVRWLLEHMPILQKRSRQKFSQFSFFNLREGILRIVRKGRS